MPVPQLLKETPSLDEVEAVAAARSKAASYLATVCTSAAAYVRELFEAQSAHFSAATVVETCAKTYEDKLKSYVTDVIRRMEGEKGNVTIWDRCIAHLRSQLVLDLQNLGYSYSAKLRKEELQREAKALAVASARNEAEISNAAKSVEDIVREATSESMKIVKELQKELKQLKSTRKPPVAHPRKTVPGSTKPAPAKGKQKEANDTSPAVAAAGDGPADSKAKERKEERKKKYYRR
ncbi:hypothetical protein DFH06DRAFT_350497 [Mycena polygramma]|nr:hypothetical protein DFH06DRAFT_350497 [Mycena polygramma]